MQAEFLTALQDAGLRPPEIIADGRLHRCPVEGKPHQRDGAYLFHSDPPASGWWQNWRTGAEATWSAKTDRPLTPAERDELARRVEADRQAREAEQARARAAAAQRAGEILAAAQPCEGHPYLERKGVKPCPGLKVDAEGRLLVPVHGGAGAELRSLQTISPDGVKRFLPGGRLAGGYFALKANAPQAGPLLIAEGLATGLSLREATGHTVLVAFNCDNLAAVARLARDRYPGREIILCGDDDRATEGNPGLTKARAAALAVGGKLALPVFAQPRAGTDFNDLHQAEGLAVVKAQVTAASPVEAEAPSHQGDTSLSSHNSQAAEAQEEWEPALPKWPVLPPAALPGLAGEFVRLACRASEADPAAVLLTFLTQFGVEVGPGPHVQVGEARHPARLFVAVVGASAKARKGTSAKPVAALFAPLAERGWLPAQHTPGPLSSGEGVAWRVRDEVVSWQVDRKTGEGAWVVTDPGEGNKRLFVLDEELAAGLTCTRREGNTLSTALRSLWDTGDLEPLTKTSRVKTTGAHVGVVSHITLAELGRALGEVEALNGFANRFLWVCARRQGVVPFPAPMPPDELDHLRGRLLDRLAAGQSSRRYDFAPEAAALWAAEYPRLSADHPGLAGCTINRGEAQTLRLALLYALLDGAERIEAAHLEAALAVWGYCRDSALYVFGGREVDPLAGRVLAALEGGPLSATDLYRTLGNHTSKGRLQGALSELLASGRVVESRELTKGRPRSAFRLCEKSELSEESPSGRASGGDTSLSSLDSQAAEEKWAGPAEVVL